MNVKRFNMCALVANVEILMEVMYAIVHPAGDSTRQLQFVWMNAKNFVMMNGIQGGVIGRDLCSWADRNAVVLKVLHGADIVNVVQHQIHQSFFVYVKEEWEDQISLKI